MAVQDNGLKEANIHGLGGLRHCRGRWHHVGNAGLHGREPMLWHGAVVKRASTKTVDLCGGEMYASTPPIMAGLSALLGAPTAGFHPGVEMVGDPTAKTINSWGFGGHWRLVI